MNKLLLIWPLLGGLLALLVALLLTQNIIKRSRGNSTMVEFSRAIRAGARAFLLRDYIHIGIFVGAVLALILTADYFQPKAHIDWKTAFAFVLGSGCTALAGYLGMAIATRTNCRTAEAAREGGIREAVCVAYSGGAVMGLSVTSLSLLGLCLLLFITHGRFQIVNAFALGASLVALLVRLSGGIYTKGADIGADLVGKIEVGFSEDDARNAALIADNAGDNVGDVMGLGSSLMESYIEAIVAAMAIATTLKLNLPELRSFLIAFPLLIAALGVVGSIIGIFFIRLFTHSNPQRTLLQGVSLAAVLTIIGSWFLIDRLGGSFSEDLHKEFYTKIGLYYAVLTGFVVGALSSFTAEYYTSARFHPTRQISSRSQFGPALTVLEGLSVGMKSTALPTLMLAGAMMIAFQQAGFYGIALAATGMLSIVAMIVSINAYGPIADNAGSIAEISHMERPVRDIMDNLNAVGNTTTAMGKGYATGSAAFVSLALLAAFIKTAGIKPAMLTYNDPRVLAGLLVGAMIPYFYSSLLFRAVVISASAVMDEVRRQFREIPGILEGKARPDYTRCAEIATSQALRGMLAPALLALVVPVLTGLLLGKEMLTCLLIGSLVSGLMLGTQSAISGGAMDNAKRHIEEGYHGGEGSEAHRAAVVGDTIGDPLKDTVGPSINILIKLMCVIALVIAPLL